MARPNGPHQLRSGAYPEKRQGVVAKAQRLLIIVSSHLSNSKLREQVGVADASVAICDDAWIGANGILSSNMKIGQRAIVAGGGVATKNVPPCTVVVWNPSRFLRSLDE